MHTSEISEACRTGQPLNQKNKHKGLQMAALAEMNLKDALLEKEWVVTIQTPLQGKAPLLDALRQGVDLIQGYYDCCLHVSPPGEQQFRALAGSHAGAEHTIQSVPVVDITISIAPDKQLLEQTLALILENHVHEEPTIRITECWATRSKYTTDTSNPNRYWNRPDAQDIHGTVIQHTADKG
jgi:hypothetical protein